MIQEIYELSVALYLVYIVVDEFVASCKQGISIEVVRTKKSSLKHLVTQTIEAKRLLIAAQSYEIRIQLTSQLINTIYYMTFIA